MTDLVGKHLGKYALARVLGRGGMAVVYAARDESLGREVALKVIRAELLEDPAFLERFKREARAVATLVHPHILQIYELAEAQGLFYFVTPIVAGGTLAERLRQGPATWEEAEGIARQLASALDYAHSRGVIHRDLKPSNVLLDGDGNVHLTDFGVAKLVQDSRGDATMAGTLIGTPTYMAPEALLGEKVDARADLYALGIIVFEMLAGRPPFTGTTVHALMHAHLSGERPSLRALRPDVSWTTDQAFAKGLARSANERFNTARELVDAIFGPHASGQGAASKRVTRSGLAVASGVLAAGLLALAVLGLAAHGDIANLLRQLDLLRNASPALINAALWLVFLVAAIVGIAGIAKLWARPYLMTHARQRSKASSPSEETESASGSSDLASRTILEAPLSPAKVSPPQEVEEYDSTRIIPGPPAAETDLTHGVAVAITQCSNTARIGTRVRIEHFPFRIGRGSETELTIAEDMALSRLHVAIESRSGQFEIRDAGSTNGVYVNGRLVPPHGSSRLLFGDVIRLSSSTTLRFVLDEAWQLPQLIGKVVGGQYRLSELLSSSEKAALYVAEDQMLPRRVAVKILSPRLAAYAGYREQFNREAEMAARLSHPHICKVLRFGQDDLAMEQDGSLRVTYLCMEFMQGGNLAQRLASKEPVPTRLVADWARKLGSALDYAHREGVVHAGIKPTSIVFDRADNLYITDFAIASRLGEAYTGTLVGAPAFLAPEQWEGKDPTPATDQYALSVILYVLLTGERPYEGQEDPDVRVRNLRRGPVPASEAAVRVGRKDVPAAVSEVLARALANDPDARYASIDEFVSAFERALTRRTDTEPSVFLSYSRDASAGWAALIAKELKQHHHIHVFLDTQAVDAAGRFPVRLQRAIEKCDVFVCLLAGDTLKSDWVRQEIRIAKQHEKPMVPVFQESFDPAHFAGSVDVSVDELLTYDAVHLLDRRNIHVDHTIADLASIITRTVRDASGER